MGTLMFLTSLLCLVCLPKTADWKLQSGTFLMQRPAHCVAIEWRPTSLIQIATEGLRPRSQLQARTTVPRSPTCSMFQLKTEGSRRPSKTSLGDGSELSFSGTWRTTSWLLLEAAVFPRRSRSCVVNAVYGTKRQQEVEAPLLLTKRGMSPQARMTSWIRWRHCSLMPRWMEDCVLLAVRCDLSAQRAHFLQSLRRCSRLLKMTSLRPPSKEAAEHGIRPLRDVLFSWMPARLRLVCV
mmetsp:Transcript_19990/g.53428  ORF Transcript_19990/g.53428 Transcript_19990/m.53428 type:complete len:238 (+) Transcript_19990:641-1354(+)